MRFLVERERRFFKESMDREKDAAKRKVSQLCLFGFSALLSIAQKEEKERQRKEELARSKQVPQKAIKLFAKADAPSRERQNELAKVSALFDESVSSIYSVHLYGNSALVPSVRSFGLDDFLCQLPHKVVDHRHLFYAGL